MQNGLRNLCRRRVIESINTCSIFQEIALPLYSLGLLIFIKFALPNPNFPVMDTPHGEAELFNHFQKNSSHVIHVVPNTTDTQEFLKRVDQLWYSSAVNATPLKWILYETEEDLLTAYWMRPDRVSLAVIFEEPGPINGQLRCILNYTLRRVLRKRLK